MQDSRVPTEVCEHIIDLTSLNDHGAPDYPTLSSCALVCRAWVPSSRRNMFFRVILHRSVQLEILLSVETPYPIRELELGLLDIPDRYNSDTDVMGPPIAPLIRANLVSEVYLLVLWNMVWLYPRIYLSPLARMESLRILELREVYFPNAGDLVGLLRCFPRLQDLTCVGLGLQYPGTMRHKAHHRVKPQQLHRVDVDGCSGAAPFILRSVVGSAPWLRDLSIRSSFLSWQPDDYAVFSVYHNVASLRITLASPTFDRRMSQGLSLIHQYRVGLEGVLSHIGLASMGQATATGLRDITVVVEPGYGTVPYLSGLKDATKAEPIRADEDHLREAASQSPQQWSYGMGRAAAVEALLGAGLEEILVDTDRGRLRPSVSTLQALYVYLWDPFEREERAWWLGEVAKQLPALHALRLLRVDVGDDWDNEGDEPLWLAEYA